MATVDEAVATVADPPLTGGDRLSAPFMVLATVLGTFLLGCAYAFAVPLGSSPDEPDHWRYAYAVQTGQDLSDGEVSVPASLAGFPAACVNERPEQDASCVPEIEPGSGSIETTTHISSYPRLYYRLVGWPLGTWPQESGLLASRVLSVALSAVLWGVAMLPWTGGGAWRMRLAVVLTATPSALFFSGSINPQGLEVAVFAALWSLSVVVFARLDAGGYRSLPLWLQITWPLALAVAVHTRLLGFWWVALLLLTCWLWFATPIRRILSDGRLLAAGAVVVAAVVVRGVAMLTQSSSSGILGTGGADVPDIPYRDLLVSAIWRALNNPAEAIGMLGWLDTRVPSGATASWFLLAGGLAFLAAPHLRRRHWVALAVLVVVVAGTWIVLDPIMTPALDTPFWQARYGFPVWMGVLFLLAAAPGRLPIVGLHRVGSAVGIVVLQVVSLAYLMIRYMWSLGWFGPVGDARWLPYAPSRIIAVAGIVGALLLAVPLLLAGRGSAVLDEQDLVTADPREVAD